MNNLISLIPAFPLLGFLILLFLGRKLSRNGIAMVGAGSICLAALLTIFIGFNFIINRPETGSYSQALWTWFEVGSFSPRISFMLDPLSLVFVFVITFVGALIHIYSVAFMADDKDYSRFFASMNLFVTSMLILVMADNLLLLYLGWEGVGLCSYLLIGFWYENPKNGYAARKAFTITRIGDTAMAIGLFLLFYNFETLFIPDILSSAPDQWELGTSSATIAAMLLLGGAMGKSAQLPLQTWLPDAMAGPSPVSALIHAATMVTAGVYLIARMNVIFQLSPFAQTAVAVIGGLTLLIAGFSALTQYDIKRVLAYSTISQIGYMFLALGVGAWSSAIFHFMTHAFFKALLFLAAGAIIETLHHEHNMFKMGGLKDKMPVVFWTFLIGSACLAALPLITSGFYSKDQILWYSWSASNGSFVFWLMGLVGAFITALYTTRMMIVTFWGESKTHLGHLPGKLMTIPLIVLAGLALAAGFVDLPHNFGHFTPFSNFLSNVLPQTIIKSEVSEWPFQLIAAGVTFGGIYLGYLFYMSKASLLVGLKQSKLVNDLINFWHSGWGFDRFYDKAFVQPIVNMSKSNKNDVLDDIYTGIVAFCKRLYLGLSYSQSGSLRWYVMGIVVGAIVVLSIQIIL
jgi:NADH-quinone oxidoreductase subunit L